MGQESKRIARANKIMLLIESNAYYNKSTNEEKLISEICLNLGAGRRYIKEIILDLINTGKIVKDVGELYTAKHHRKIKSDLRRKNN